MKRRIIFAIFMIASVLGLRAQTDVTATYVVNPGFEDCTARTTNLAAAGSAAGDNYAEAGWTLAQSSAWSASAVVAYGGNGQVNGVKAPASDNAGNGGKTLGFSVGWGGTNRYLSTTAVTLPAGHYELTINAYNNLSGVTQFKSLNGFVPTSGSSYLSSKTSFTYATWVTDVITFDLTVATEGKFQIGGQAISGGSGSNAKVFFDNITLVYTDPLQAAKAALQAEIDKAKLCDAKEGLASAIAAAEAVLASATTQAQLEQALANLQAADKDAVLRYENGLADASATNGILTNLVVNGTFTDNVDGWTCTGGFQNQARASNQNGDFTVPFFENWNGSAQVNKMYQTISNVPNGTYKLKIAAFVNTFDGTTQYVFANSDKTYLTTGDPIFYEVWTVVTNNTIEIGLEQTSATANWMGIDNVSLTYYGAGDVISQAQAGAHKTDWDEAVANAQAALANSDYANVTGKENTDLQDELAKSEPTTAQGYDDATAALRAATNAFTAAKTSYDLFAENNVTLAYADASKKPSITSTTTAATLITALRAYFESHALAEGVSSAVNKTSSITNANNPTDNSGWTITGGINNPASNEPWTDADGTSNHSYFDGGKWGDSSWTTTMEQTINLPAGRYLLTAKARAATNTTFTMEAGGQSVGLPHIGASVGTGLFDRGWGDASVEFQTAGEEVTIKVTASTSTVHEWFSISDFRLMQLEEIAVVTPDAADYAALAAAISAAEAKTLGFEAGEYAPYNNVAAQQALAAAKNIDPTSEYNTKAIVQEVTSTLTAATWTANADEVQPIYNGMFATQTEGANYPEGWARTNGWGAMQSGISGDFATAYYNQPGSLKYGSTDYYSMPLRANQAYKLTFSYRSHENNSNNGMTVSVSNEGNDLIAPTFDGNGSTSTWKTEYAYFTTGAAGDYVITLANSGNTWMTNVSLEKIASTEGDVNGDGKIDETDEWIEGLHYTAGDFNGNGTIEAAEVDTLADILVDKITDYKFNVADVNDDSEVTLADLTALVNVVNGVEEPRVVDETWKYATIDATVYAEQNAAENASDASYTINSATSIIKEDVSDKYDMKEYLTTLNIITSLSNVKSVSVYAKGKENIAGLATIRVNGEESPSITYAAGESPSVYASNDQANKNMYSDVVTVTGDNAGTYVAYLLPVSLSNGVTVTVRDNNGKFYSQDFTVTAGQENNLTFTETTATNNWMATIPGNINFSMLSTPGAHNAATSSCGSLAKCQSETIEGLLNNGVRAFDLRPGYKYSSTITTENLYIYHGIYNTNVLYKDAIAAMVTFLQAHPTEAISVIMAKEDGTPLLSSWTDYTNEMCSAIDAIHTQYTDYIKMLDHSYYTLDDYRGKIFFGYRNAWDLHKTVRVTNWPDASSVTDYSVSVGGQCYASVEDAYNTSGDSKKNVVNALLDLASANENRARFHYTFTSVANSITSSANTQNPAAATYINGLTGPTGYVYADFMGSSSYSGQTLLKAVIEQNYKYVFKGRTRVQ